MAMIMTALKDSNSVYGKALVRQSLERQRLQHPGVAFCLTPANFVVCGTVLADHLHTTYDALVKAGFVMSLYDSQVVSERAVHLTPEMPSGVSLALATVKVSSAKSKLLSLGSGHYQPPLT